MSPVPPLVRLTPSIVAPLAALAWLTAAACSPDADSAGGPPMLGGSTAGTEAGSGATIGATDDTGADETAAPIPEGPRRRRLDLDASLIGGTTDATIVVRLDDTRIEYADTQPEGTDLRFFGPDETTQYPVQIERWDPAGTSVLWVRVQGTDPLPDHLWMYYGDGESFSPFESAEVWDPEFSAVWHMSADADETLPDATSHAHRLFLNGFDGELDAEGALGLGVSFVPNGAVGPLEAEADDSLGGSEAITVEAWVSQTPGGAVGAGPSFALVHNGAVELRTKSGGMDLPSFIVRTAAGSETLNAAGSVVQSWTYLAATYDASNGRLTMYRHGQAEASAVLRGEGDDRLLSPSEDPFVVGRGFEGTLDEVRVSRIARSPQWVELQHASMSDALLSFGPPLPRTN